MTFTTKIIIATSIPVGHPTFLHKKSELEMRRRQVGPSTSLRTSRLPYKILNTDGDCFFKITIVSQLGDVTLVIVVAQPQRASLS